MIVGVGDLLSSRVADVVWMAGSVAVTLDFLYLASGALSEAAEPPSSSDDVKPACIWLFGDVVGGSLSLVRSTGCLTGCDLRLLTIGTSSLSTPGSPRLPNLPPFVRPIFLYFVSTVTLPWNREGLFSTMEVTSAISFLFFPVLKTCI